MIMLKTLLRVTLFRLDLHVTRYLHDNIALFTDHQAMNSEPSIFEPKKALILSKISRYELEKLRHRNLSEKELASKLKQRGSDYLNLVRHHKIHNESKDKLRTSLEKRGIEVKFVNRLEYNRELVDWSDVIFTTGGDGTFLIAASLIESPNKVVIGINSDPSRSVGFLCLPQPYSSDFDLLLDRLYNGKFEWLFRQRIRITLEGNSACDEPLELHNQQLISPEYRYLESDEIAGNCEIRKSPNIPKDSLSLSRTLPVRALNEAFIGEIHSARVSYCEMSVDDRPRIKFRSSGVTICTGTGSTSWSYNISRLYKQSVRSILEIAHQNNQSFQFDDQFVDDVTKQFNNALIYQPSKPIMHYTIRDPQTETESLAPRGFAKKIELRSRMYDACVVIDGGLSYSFNDGNLARFQILEEDALRTISIK